MMSTDSGKPINILDLPSEVLREILSYVSNQLIIGQVCKTFYNVSCSLKAYRLNISTRIRTKCMMVNLDEENDKFESILQSSRRIGILHITSKDNNRSLTRLRLRKVIEHVGESVKELQIQNRSFNIHGLSLINLMTNLEKIHLYGISGKGLKIPQGFKLQLHKLKELKIESSIEKILEVYDCLPDDVLHKLTLEDIESSGPPGQHFLNQRSIKHVTTYDINFIDLRQLKLKTLDTMLTGNAMKGQNELTSLTAWISDRFNQEHVDLICNELKSLEELAFLNFLFHPVYIDFSELQKLKNLKTITLNKINGESLETLKSKSVQCLKINEPPNEASFLSINCPNLREFIIQSHGNFNVDKFLIHFPQLVKLTCETAVLASSDGWENQSLEHLYTTSFIDSTKSIEFIKSCKSLKTLSIGGIFDKELMKRLLVEAPNLKSLCFHHFDPRFGGVIKEHGNNIECFHQRGAFLTLKDFLKMKEALKDVLPVSKMVMIDGVKSFSMKKHGKIEKCCNELEKIWRSV